MDVVILILIAVAIVAFWQVDVLMHPIRKCPRCRGSKTNLWSNRERWGLCRRCGGSGEVRRLGARKEN